MGRANVGGTLIGVLLLSIVKNGLLLVGISFYWQQVASGVVILLVLAISFRGRDRPRQGARRRRSARTLAAVHPRISSAGVASSIPVSPSATPRSVKCVPALQASVAPKQALKTR